MILKSGIRLSKKDFKFCTGQCSCGRDLSDPRETYLFTKVGTCFECTPGFTPLMFAPTCNRIYLPNKVQCEWDATRALEIDPHSKVEYHWSPMKVMYLFTWNWCPVRALINYGPDILKEIRCLKDRTSSSVS